MNKVIWTFTGTTRDHFKGKKVKQLEYECYETMAVKEIHKICQQIREKWNVQNLAIVHRIGYGLLKSTLFLFSWVNCLYCLLKLWNKSFYNMEDYSLYLCVPFSSIRLIPSKVQVKNCCMNTLKSAFIDLCDYDINCLWNTNLEPVWFEN